MTNYSIIIPTHNRHQFIAKNIEYFSTFMKCTVYIADSSKTAYIGEFPSGIKYLHMPDKSFVQKMNEVLILVDTQYVAACADDDYILENTAVQMMTSMTEEGYIMSVGRYAGFNIPFDGFYSIYNKKLSSLKSSKPDQRVAKYLGNYYMSLWAIYDTETIKKAYDILLRSSFTNHNLIEIIIAITCAASGKILFSEDLYGIREVNNKDSDNWAKEHISLSIEYNNRTLEKQIISIEKEFSKYFDKKLLHIGINKYLNVSFFNYVKIQMNKVLSKIYKQDRPNIDEGQLEAISELILKYQNPGATLTV